MKECFVCGRKSIIQEFIWIKGRYEMREVCCNPRCRKYNTYVMYKWK